MSFNIKDISDTIYNSYSFEFAFDKQMNMNSFNSRNILDKSGMDTSLGKLGT